MLLLRAGTQTIAVAPNIQQLWGPVAARALSEAADSGVVTPHVRFLTDSGSFGVLPLADTVAISFEDSEEAPSAAYLGSIVMIGPDVDRYLETQI